jgi:tRNA pseudouridine55 synthase
MNGLLIIDKPQGPSSHDVVARARRWTGIKRIGHAGTLDPLATGVLILCLGNATRLSEYLLGEDKAYDGVIKLGERTNTDDAEGEVIATRPVPPIGDEDLRRLAQQFMGETEQVPPQFSAIQRDGQRAYALARKGEEVELQPRRITVYELALSRLDDSRLMTDDSHQSSVISHLAIHVRCSSGTYIRALARDIGEALGCGGHLVSLRRTQCGPFTLDDAVTLDQLERSARAGAWQQHLLPMDRAVQHLPIVQVNEENARRILHGQIVDAPSTHSAQTPNANTNLHRNLCRVYDSRRELIAIAECRESKLKPVKVFGQSQQA